MVTKKHKNRETCEPQFVQVLHGSGQRLLWAMGSFFSRLCPLQQCIMGLRLRLQACWHSGPLAGTKLLKICQKHRHKPYWFLQRHTQHIPDIYIYIYNSDIDLKTTKHILVSDNPNICFNLYLCVAYALLYFLKFSLIGNYSELKWFILFKRCWVGF